MDKLTKAFIALNNNIDAELDKTYQILSDKYLNLKLSHNRKKQALENILKYCRSWQPVIPPDYQFIADICENALYSDGRILERRKK